MTDDLKAKAIALYDQGSWQFLVDAPPPPLKQTWDRIPMRRIGQPSDIVGAAVFLASDEASWITGINLVIDGGGSVLG